MKRSSVGVMAVLAVLGLAAAAWAVKPEEWKHDQPKDFLVGELKNVVVSSQSEVMLGRDAKVLQKLGEDVASVTALARAGDGKIYAATGPAGRIYQVDGDAVREFAKLPEDGTVFSLLFTEEGHLLAGTGGGEQARIYRIGGDGKAAIFYEPKGAKHIWAMVRGPQGEIYAATGVEGQLYVIDADGRSGRVLAKVKPRNLLCLAMGGNGMLYGGTDEEGLVYRINPNTGKLYVMYDAKEPEISSIVLDEEGNVFASTGSAEGARPGRSVADRAGGTPDRVEPGATRTPGTRPAANPPRTGRPTTQAGGSPTSQPTTRHGLGHTIGRMTEGGNAIYRIDVNGFVTEVFREPVVILGLAERDGTVYAATGNEGRIYSVVPDQERTTMLAKLESAQAVRLLVLPDGQLFVGTGNAASIVRLVARRAPSGTLLSKALDAGQIVKWGRVHWDASVPQGTTLTVATRSSNVEDVESNAWDDWSAEMDATTEQQIPSPSARFLQYRLTFKTTVGDATPVLRSLTIPRIEENRAPELPALEVLPAREEAQKPTAPSIVKALVGAAGFGAAAPTGPDDYWVIKWRAEDPNKDTLVYDVYYRQVGTQRWVRIAKDVKEMLKVWDTRTVEDGKYQVRVVARDTPSNPPGTDLSAARISDPIIVDNTPPEVTFDSVEVAGKNVKVHAKLHDALSPIDEASYNLDSDEDWVALAADDDVFDSPDEAVTFTVKDLAPGEHRIALRVKDDHGNTRYVSRSVTIEAK